MHFFRGLVPIHEKVGDEGYPGHTNTLRKDARICFWKWITMKRKLSMMKKVFFKSITLSVVTTLVLLITLFPLQVKGESVTPLKNEMRAKKGARF